MNTTSFSTLILKTLKYSLLFIPHFLFFSLTRFVRKEKNLWLFGAWHGEKYSDNSKYLISCQNSLPLKLEKGEAENELFRGVQSISY